MFVRLIFPPDSSAKLMLSPGILIYGNTYALICLLYPLELMRPGWLNVRRIALLFLPAVVMGIIYFAVVRIQGDTIHEIRRLGDLTNNFWKFDVWFRFTIFIYPVWLFLRTLRYKIAYNRWCEDNCSSKENKSLELLNKYNILFLLILTSYIIVIMVNNANNRILHGVLFLVFIGFLFYQNLFNIVPVVIQNNSPFYAEKEEEDSGDDPLNGYMEESQHNFADKMPQYKEKLEKWMAADKPYRNPQFKLLDCTSVLPLNRSYLSRLFNEGYNETFFTFVMHYRIDEGARLLSAYPDLTVARISEMCGFSSPSVFGRAFLKHKGITPLQYRRKYKISEAKAS